MNNYSQADKILLKLTSLIKWPELRRTTGDWITGEIGPEEAVREMNRLQESLSYVLHPAELNRRQASPKNKIAFKASEALFLEEKARLVETIMTLSSETTDAVGKLVAVERNIKMSNTR